VDPRRLWYIYLWFVGGDDSYGIIRRIHSLLVVVVVVADVVSKKNYNCFGHVSFYLLSYYERDLIVVACQSQLWSGDNIFGGNVILKIFLSLCFTIPVAWDRMRPIIAILFHKVFPSLSSLFTVKINIVQRVHLLFLF
jgi:hypothetical protein